MFTKIKLHLSIIFLIFLSIGYAQTKKFTVKIFVPKTINEEKISISYYDGKSVIAVNVRTVNNAITFSGSFYSKFAVLYLNYQKNTYSAFINSFFIPNKKVTIKCYYQKKDSLFSPFANCKIENGFEVEKTIFYKKMHRFTQNERLELEKFFQLYSQQLDTNETLLKEANDKSLNLVNRQIKYFEQLNNSNSYYALWLFKTEIVNTLLLDNPKKLKEIFTSSFSSTLRNSFEGIEINNLLNGALYTKKGLPAFEFKAVDIDGNKIELKKLREKYVLLQFWASWCSPCIDEIPILKEIYLKYNKNVEVIGITSDIDSIKFNSTLKKLDIKWKQIFRNTSIINKYGNKPIPSLYLIDQKGVIIFSSWEDKMSKLLEILAAKFYN